MADTYTIETKPHGHGDVHQLLLREGVLADWQAVGIKWVFFLQDTNVLVLNSVLPALGVSKKRDLDMNSICVPRTAGEAAGAITKLVNEATGEELTINVEYNQLDPLLRATINPDGDVNDPETGHSPFPGNVNNLIFKLDSYKRVCEGEAQGVVPEFVNPKYADEQRERFKKPTRLECMMQDFPQLMKEELPQGTSKVGFVSFPKWLSFNPAKNSLEGGVGLIKNGNPPGTVAAAEANYYEVFATRMIDFGTTFTGDAATVDIKGLPQALGPYIYISPDIALTTENFKPGFSGGLTMDRQSALQIEGQGSVSFKGVELDGDLTIELVAGAHLTLEGTKIHTGKPSIENLSDDEPPFLAIRGYNLSRAGDRVTIQITEPGNWVVKASPDKVHRLRRWR
jgi:UDP-sugar pyrophosphorylase